MLSFPTNEMNTSQLPAVQLLVAMGYEYIPVNEALRQRNNRFSNVLLEGVLRDQLKALNHINYKNQKFRFSEENIQSAIQKIKSIKYDGLVTANKAVYELLTLGTSLVQIIDGNTKSYNLKYVDWHHPKQNKFHVTVEYSVERNRSVETARPDIVLFVNGIPFGVIECKAPEVEMQQAVSQMIRNQRDDYIPKLFTYCQLLLVTNKNETKYGTVSTEERFWSLWKEHGLKEGDEKYETLLKLIQQPLSEQIIKQLCADFNSSPSFGSGRTYITEQDKAIYALYRPQRLLELTWKFSIFDAGIRKITRYNQFDSVKAVINRVKEIGQDGKRESGMIWQTQGSGKSLAMVMLARSLALEPSIPNPRIILVTDRVDLDYQLRNTFKDCGMIPQRAKSGKNLLELISVVNADLITTVVHKFERMQVKKNYKDKSADIFILVDESHRTQFGSFAAQMRKTFPNACYLGFTGTPLTKKEKNNIATFGHLIKPSYPIQQAVEDGAVVPLMYEGRHTLMDQNKAIVDKWFDRHTENLNEKQKNDLRTKFSRANKLSEADQVIYHKAFDIYEHYIDNWKGTGFKAQLVAPSKLAALKFQEYLVLFGEEDKKATAEVIISGSDMRKGYQEIDDDSSDRVVKFWKRMMDRYKSEENYNQEIIRQFKSEDEPDILIVVDKLLTGFDAPRNTILYLCTQMSGHTLLQAIARVNRVYPNKEYGYIIDYENILENLDKALTEYAELADYDEGDLKEAMISTEKEVNKLPQTHSRLWDIFNEIKNSREEEEYEVFLANEERRDEFYSRLTDYAKNLKISLSYGKFILETDNYELEKYKNDLKRFQSLKKSVKIRYADAIDFRDYEPKIQKLLDDQIRADDVISLNKPLNIFDTKMFDQFVEDHLKISSKVAVADSIAYATKKAIKERVGEDPEYYGKFSEMIQETIDDYNKKRISAQEYLEKAKEIRGKVVNQMRDDIPIKLQGKKDAAAYYGVIRKCLSEELSQLSNSEEIQADIAIKIDAILRKHNKVHFWDDQDAQNKAKNDIDDYLYDTFKESGVELNVSQIDEILDKTFNIAKCRSISYANNY